MSIMKPFRIRKALLNLEKKELQALNDGFEALVAVEGFGGYQQIAGVYGKPGSSYRPTAPHLFLPWHRAYLLSFENMLNRVWPGLALSYWDWTQESNYVQGIPGRLKKVAYSDQDQGVWLNQFYRAPIDCLGHERFTERDPGDAAQLKTLAAKVQDALSQSAFEDFGGLMEEVSQEFRAWVGGHQASDDYAAYDPLFWFHHANIDRLWAHWQRTHGEATMPQAVLDSVLEPFAVKASSVLNLDHLGYVYDQNRISEKR
jgi:tyrosinase